MLTADFKNGIGKIAKPSNFNLRRAIQVYESVDYGQMKQGAYALYSKGLLPITTPVLDLFH